MDNKATQKAVLEAVSTERRFQDLAAKAKKDDTIITVPGEILVISSLLAKASAIYASEEIFKDTVALDVVRQIAGVAVRCLEHNGLIHREW